MRADLRRVSEAYDLTDSIVFVRTEGLLYNDGFFMNDPFLRDGAIYARDLGPRNLELMEAYPERKAFRWTKNSLLPLRPSRLPAVAPTDPALLLQGLITASIYCGDAVAERLPRQAGTFVGKGAVGGRADAHSLVLADQQVGDSVDDEA